MNRKTFLTALFIAPLARAFGKTLPKPFPWLIPRRSAKEWSLKDHKYLWGCTFLKGTIKTRPNGTRYMDCGDGREREIYPQISTKDLQELDRRAFERGEIPTLQGWIQKADQEDLKNL